MNGLRPDTDSSWLVRLKRLKPWITRAAWLAWLASALILVLNPQSEALLVLVLLAVLVLALSVPSTVVLALAYRRLLATWPGVGLLVVALGLAFAGAGSTLAAWPVASGILTAAELSLPVAYFVSVSAFLWRRDASVALLAGLLLIGVWTAAVSVVRYGGPVNLILSYLESGGTGGFWWWNTVTTAFWCALPPIGVAFFAHLIRLTYLEWRRG